jgi:hypothetical protein
MRVRIVKFLESGLVVQPRWKKADGFTVAYGEILTAERMGSPTRIRFHTRTTEALIVSCRGVGRTAAEDRLRQHGVRIVDEFGAMITPTVEDFAAELAREPMSVRQSSDNA